MSVETMIPNPYSWYVGGSGGFKGIPDEVAVCPKCAGEPVIVEIGIREPFAHAVRCERCGWGIAPRSDEMGVVGFVLGYRAFERWNDLAQSTNQSM